MTFIYFSCKFYRISNAIVCEALILNYNAKFNLGICLFFLVYIFMLCFEFYIYIYIILKIFLFDSMVDH